MPIFHAEDGECTVVDCRGELEGRQRIVLRQVTTWRIVNGRVTQEPTTFARIVWGAHHALRDPELKLDGQ